MKKTAKFFIFGTVFLLVAIIFTFLTQTFDVSTPQRLCTDGTCDDQNLASICEISDCSIGFSTFNMTVFNKIGANQSLYKISEFVGYIPVIFVGIYGIIGLTQLIKRKSLKKVDPELFALAGLFVTILATYILFEKLALNVRPVCVAGELEASFPSSHTVLALCVCFGIIILNLTFHLKEKLYTIINIILSSASAFILASRFFSGFHWATDIIGGIFYSIAFLLIYSGIIFSIFNAKNSKT